MQLQENSIFDSHYTLIRQLGRGGFSEVWLAHDSYMDLDVALKIYAPGLGMDQNSIDDFRHEIKAVFSLNHSNLLTPRYLGVYNGMPYLVLPYCPNGSVTRYIGKMDEQQVTALIHDVAAGLAYLHSKDIIHQDIKPGNILIDENGNFLITDFGISAKARSTLRKSVMGNVSGGTMAYMAPERFSSQPAPVKASDIWALGAMSYEMLTGDVPFGDLGGTAQKAGADIPEILQPVSDQLRLSVQNMLNKDPWARPTAEQLTQTEPLNPHHSELTATIPLAPSAPERPTQPLAQNTLSVSEETISASPEPNTFTIQIQSNSPWEAKGDAIWISCVKNSETELLIHCERNREISGRTANVIISTADDKKSISVTQSANMSRSSLVLNIFIIIALIIIMELLFVFFFD